MYNVRHFPTAIIFREKWKKYLRITTVLQHGLQYFLLGYKIIPSNEIWINLFKFYLGAVKVMSL